MNAAQAVSEACDYLSSLVVDEVREGLIQPLARHRAITCWHGFRCLLRTAEQFSGF